LFSYIQMFVHYVLKEDGFVIMVLMFSYIQFVHHSSLLF